MTGEAGQPIVIDDETQRVLEELAVVSGKDVAELVKLAVGDLDRHVRGDRAEGVTLGPFRKLWSDRPADVALRQVDASNFILEEPFRYVADGTIEGLAVDEVITVPDGDKTDLASVPQLFTWLVPRYGRHSMPALLHDYLQHYEVDGAAFDSDLADKIFRETMAESGVPLVRRWLMWAAVNLRTRFNDSPKAKVAVVTWALLYAIAVPFVGPFVAIAAYGSHPVTVIATAGAVFVLPLVSLAIPWKYRKLSFVSAYGMTAAAWPGLGVIAGAGMYLAAEWVFSAFSSDPAPIFNKRGGA